MSAPSLQPQTVGGGLGGRTMVALGAVVSLSFTASHLAPNVWAALVCGVVGWIAMHYLLKHSPPSSWVVTEHALVEEGALLVRH